MRIFICRSAGNYSEPIDQPDDLAFRLDYHAFLADLRDAEPRDVVMG